MGRDIKINPTGGTISFSGTNSTMINIDYNSGELNFNTHLGNDFKITSNLELDNIKFMPSVSVKKENSNELIDDLGKWKGYPMNMIGPTGTQGPNGPTGLKGSRAVDGEKGLKGKKGLKGITSTEQGPQGDQGTKGLKGIKGEKANQGPIGPTGVKGQIGPQGNTGPIGPTSLKGPVGPQGFKGFKGNKGIKGLIGDSLKGPTGLSASKGNQGPTGTNKGPIGPKGEVGVKGPQGPIGITANVDVYVFYDATSMPSDKAKEASQSVRDWFQTVNGDGDINKLYEGVIGKNSHNGENWLWWASYPYLGSLSGGTLSDNTQINEFNSAVPNATYQSDYCKSNSGGNCVPRNSQFNDGETIYRRINRGVNLDTGAAETISQGVPFDHSDLNNTETSGQGSFGGDNTNYLVIIVADESDGLVGLYHGQVGGTNSNPTKSDLYNKPFELNGNYWNNNAGDEYTNRYLHDYCSYVQVYEDIISNRGGNAQGLVYPVVNPLRGTSTYAFVQHAVAAIEGSTITSNEFLNRYGDNITSVGPENLNLSALTRTNVYSGLTSETCYTNLESSFKNGS